MNEVNTEVKEVDQAKLPSAQVALMKEPPHEARSKPVEEVK